MWQQGNGKANSDNTFEMMICPRGGNRTHDTLQSKAECSTHCEVYWGSSADIMVFKSATQDESKLELTMLCTQQYVVCICSSIVSSILSAKHVPQTNHTLISCNFFSSSPHFFPSHHSQLLCLRVWLVVVVVVISATEHFIGRLVMGLVYIGASCIARCVPFFIWLPHSELWKIRKFYSFDPHTVSIHAISLSTVVLSIQGLTCI